MGGASSLGGSLGGGGLIGPFVLVEKGMCVLCREF